MSGSASRLRQRSHRPMRPAPLTALTSCPRAADRRPWYNLTLTQQEIEVRGGRVGEGGMAARRTSALSLVRLAWPTRQPMRGLQPAVEGRQALLHPTLQLPPSAGTQPWRLPAPCLTRLQPPRSTPQEDMALIISNTKRRPRIVKEKSPSGYHSG